MVIIDNNPKATLIKDWLTHTDYYKHNVVTWEMIRKRLKEIDEGCLKK